MAHLVLQDNRAHVVNKSFACARYELKQELATHLQIPKDSITDIRVYMNEEVAQTIANFMFNHEEVQ